MLSAGGAASVTSVGVELVANVPMFRAYTDASPDPYGVPLYEPTTEHERGLAAVFGRALELGRPVEVEYRDSLFFGPHRVPVSVRLARATRHAGGTRARRHVGLEGTDAGRGEAAMARGVAERRVLKVRDGQARRARDRLAVEEPLELRVAGRPVGVTMRTPGNDVELAIGYCISERLVARPDDVATVRFCAPEGQAQEYNVLSVDLRPGVPVPDPSLDRLAVTSSSCGVCGKSSIEAVTVACAPVAGDPLVVPSEVLAAVPARVREAQRVFEQTGGLHAAAVCDATGAVACVREDVGRHNAVDKVIGWAATQRRLPLAGMLMFVSGRCSFEVVQKAAVAGVPLIAAVSAPSSLAVELADEVGVTLVGFLRGASMNVYTHPERVAVAARDGEPAAPAGRAEPVSQGPR